SESAPTMAPPAPPTTAPTGPATTAPPTAPAAALFWVLVAHAAAVIANAIAKAPDRIVFIVRSFHSEVPPTRIKSGVARKVHNTDLAVSRANRCKVRHWSLQHIPGRLFLL